jgi:hypothetical protein
VAVFDVLQRDIENRFWRQLHEFISRRKYKWTRYLLDLYVRGVLRDQVFPPRLGRQLTQILYSVHPSADCFPLVRFKRAFQVARLAGEQEMEDALDWIDAISGRLLMRSRMRRTRVAGAASDSTAKAVAWVLRSTSESTLNQSVEEPADHALGTFTVSQPRLRSVEACWYLIMRFYAHLMGSSGLGWIPTDPKLVMAEAHALLAAAFAQEGGVQAAEAMMLSGAGGGVRQVFRLVTQRFKHDLWQKHVRRVLYEAVSPLDAAQRLGFTCALLKRLRPFLTPDQIRREAQDFASPEKIEQLVHLLCSVQSHLAQTFRRM